jgi:hypothetical protein
MAANTHKRKSACPSTKSKKAKAAEAEGANDRAAEANAEARALEGGGVNTPFFLTNNAGPPTVFTIGVDDVTALTMMTMATKGGDEDKDADAVVVMTTTTTSAIDKYAPLPARGGDNDAIVIVDKALYPDKGEARMAGSEATGEDGEWGASLMPTTMMTTATKGGDKDEDTDAMPSLRQQ